MQFAHVDRPSIDAFLRRSTSAMNMRLATVLSAVLLLAGCTSFPTARPGATFADGLGAAQIFEQSLAEHGGDLREHPGDINLSTDGRWYSLIQRIQPVVTDAGFRVTSQERYRPADGLYVVDHEGPLGTKRVVRTADGIAISYNGVVDTDAERRRATAMTNDAFRLFHFGPSFVLERTTSMARLADAREGGRRYHRLLATLRPGFGESDEDRVLLWIDTETSRLFRVHLTLEGFETTRGAHVDTTFLEWRREGRWLLPVRFSERVRGPLRIMAHEWHVTGLDVDRGWQPPEVGGAEFTGRAAAPARALSPAK
jgi:hypothetical protein